MAETISQNPAEMTVGEYISENLSRMDPNSPEYKELKRFYDTQVKGQSLVNKYIGNVSSTFKDMFEKASGVKFGELHTQPNQAEMQQPEIVTEAKQSLVGSDPNKVDNTDINRRGGSISSDPNEMTLEEYVAENLNRFAANDPKRAALQKFYNENIKGRPLRNRYIGNTNPLIKDMFEKASGVKFGELYGQPRQTQMQEPEVVTEARQPFAGSNPGKVTNDVLSKQVNNIQKFDNATAAGQGRNTEAAKQAQDAIRDSRRLVNSAKQGGVQDIPVTDPTSDSWYTESPNGNGGTTGGGGSGSSNGGATGGNTTGEPEKSNDLNKLLLADILMTGVRNALHYRPAFRTAYGEDIEGRDFGTEKSLAMKLAEENMKRGLERSNQRKDTEAQTEAEVAATKKKGSDKEYAKAKQNLGIVSGTQTTSKNETKVRPWGTTQTSTTGTVPVNLNQNWNNVRTSN